jgi:hypothetical protein
VFQTEFSGDAGIEFVFGDKDNYLVLNSIFTIQYLEDLS